MLVGLVSAKGSPGVTTSALALASEWPRTALLLDADPFGGDVRAGLGGGHWPDGAGLAELVADLRSNDLDTALIRRVHRPGPHSPPVLAGLGCIGQTGGVPWAQIARSLGTMCHADTIADCGRFALADGVAPLLQACDALVLVTGSSLPEVRSAARVVPLLLEPAAALSLLVVAGGEPYEPEEIADACRLPLLGELPADPRTASVWSDGAAPGRGFSRSRLQRAARRIGGRLGAPHGSRGAE